MPTILCRERKYRRNVEGDVKAAERKRIYDTVRWRKFRLLKLQTNPCCEVCEKDGRTTPATEVHHKVSFLTGNSPEAQYALAFDFDNLMSLCRRCHSQLHNKK
jgi:5-methylcytosine-specific restriction protein A